MMHPASSATDPSRAPTFDEITQAKYEASDKRLHAAISHSFSDSQTKQQECEEFVRHLRIHKNLFFHTYVHLATCKKGKLARLMSDVAPWKKWNSVPQLARHALIKGTLLRLWAGEKCRQHQSLCDKGFVISDDDDDLLCLALYCCKKEELYDLSRRPAISAHGGSFKESEKVIELLWKLLKEHEGKGDVRVTHRLYAGIYRMARKSAYLPCALQIQPSSLSNGQTFHPASGATALMTLATMDGKQVIVKKIPCNDRDTRRKRLEMFASEAILWGMLRHKNIVPFLGVVVQGDSIALVSPFLRNGSVTAYLKGVDSRSWPDLAKRLCKELAEALKYIHYHDPPIIHGDLKGDNVLVDDLGHARLGDFGQSHASDSGRFLDSTRVGLPAENPFRWMAPELMVEDIVKATDRSDIYSFGCVLYEMVSGVVPFKEVLGKDVSDHVRSGKRPPRPMSISEDDPLWKVAEDCWKSEPKERPSARRLVSCLVNTLPYAALD